MTTSNGHEEQPTTPARAPLPLNGEWRSCHPSRRLTAGAYVRIAGTTMVARVMGTADSGNPVIQFHRQEHAKQYSRHMLEWYSPFGPATPEWWGETDEERAANGRPRRAFWAPIVFRDVVGIISVEDAARYARDAITRERRSEVRAEDAPYRTAEEVLRDADAHSVGLATEPRWQRYDAKNEPSLNDVVRYHGPRGPAGMGRVVGRRWSSGTKFAKVESVEVEWSPAWRIWYDLDSLEFNGANRSAPPAPPPSAWKAYSKDTRPEVGDVVKTIWSDDPTDIGEVTEVSGDPGSMTDRVEVRWTPTQTGSYAFPNLLHDAIIRETRDKARAEAAKAAAAAAGFSIEGDWRELHKVLGCASGQSLVDRAKGMVRDLGRSKEMLGRLHGAAAALFGEHRSFISSLYGNKLHRELWGNLGEVMFGADDERVKEFRS